MRHRSLPIGVIAFVIGVAVSPLAARTPAASADTALPCVTADAPATTAPEAAPEPALPDPPESTHEEVTTPTVHVSLSEVFPDPEGDDAAGEFIEVANAGSAGAGLTGWTITNAAGRTFTLNVTVGPSAKYAFPYAETKIALSNAGTTLTLRDPSGNAVDTMSYAGPAKTGMAYARREDGTWAWTSTPTPGAENAFDPPPPPPPTSSGDAPSQPVTVPVPDPQAPAPMAPADIVVTALLPDPVGDDAAEWIEIGNAGAVEAGLSGWKIDDADGGSAPFPLDGVSVPAGARTRIPRTDSKIALNNDGDEVRLIGPDGIVRQVVAYRQAPEGAVYVNVDGTWTWQMPKPDVRTAAPEAGTVAGQQGGPADGTPAAESEPTVPASIGDISPDDDTLLEVEGVVTLAPGVIGKRTFAMADPDGRTGIFVRAYGSSPMPALAAGDRITVTGRAARNGGFATVGGGIAKTGRGTLLFQERDAAYVDDADGLALSVTGIVTRRGKNSFLLADAGGTREIAVRPAVKTGPDGKIAVGATVAVKGVLRKKGDSFELISGADGAISLLTPAAPPVPRADAVRPRATADDPAPIEPRHPLVFGYAAEKTAPVAMGAVAAVSVATAAAAALLARRRRAAELDRLAADR